MPPLDVGGFSGFFTHSCMLLMWDHRLVSRPKGGSAMSLAVDKWNDLPQALTRLFASIPNGIGDHLTALSAQGNPNPRVVGFFEHKRPQLVQLQRRGSGILQIRGEQGCL
jgi:hypothetical protein